jgi:hypothetical protein
MMSATPVATEDHNSDGRCWCDHLPLLLGVQASHLFTKQSCMPHWKGRLWLHINRNAGTCNREDSIFYANHFLLITLCGDWLCASIFYITISTDIPTLVRLQNIRKRMMSPLLTLQYLTQRMISHPLLSLKYLTQRIPSPLTWMIVATTLKRWAQVFKCLVYLLVVSWLLIKLYKFMIRFGC